MNVSFIVIAKLVSFINKHWEHYRIASLNDSTTEIPEHLIDDVTNSSYKDTNSRNSHIQRK